MIGKLIDWWQGLKPVPAEQLTAELKKEVEELLFSKCAERFCDRKVMWTGGTATCIRCGASIYDIKEVK